MRIFIMAILISIASNAHALVGALQFSPTAPNSKDIITVRAATPGGPFINAGADGLNREVLLVGNTIKIIIPSDILCGFTAPCANSGFQARINAFPAGVYTIEVYQDNVSKLVQTGSISIAQGNNELSRVPSISVEGLLLLSLMTLFGAYFSIAKPA